MSEFASILRKFLALHEKGIICCAEVWHQIADSLNEGNACDLLDDLPDDLLLRLLSFSKNCWRSLNVETEPTAVRRQLAKWLEARLESLEHDRIRFTDKDAAILYCTPKVPVDLSDIIRCYVFTCRDAPPTFDDLCGCLSRAWRAGIFRRTDDGKLVIDSDWYARIHAADGTGINEIQSLLEFEEEFVGRNWPVTEATELTITQDEYDDAIERAKWGRES